MARGAQADWEVWRSFFETHAALLARLDADLQAEHGMSLRRMDVLLHLVAAPGGRLSMGDLAQNVVISQSGLSGLVDRMERDGMLERAPVEGNRRSTWVRITRAGRRAYERAWASHRSSVGELFLEPLGAEGCDALRGALARLPTYGGTDVDRHA